MKSASSGVNPAFFSAKSSASSEYKRVLSQTFLANTGIKVSDGKKSILAQMKSQFKTTLSETQMIGFAKNLETFLSAMSRSEGSSVFNELPIPHLPTKILDLQSVELTTDYTGDIYKYVTKDTLEKYIKKDSFRLGALLDYQNTFEENIKDAKEGYTQVFIDIHEKQSCQAFFSGFNYLIFCGTDVSPDDARSDKLKDNFGPCVIRIRDVRQFTKVIAEFLLSELAVCRRVEYQPVKIIRTRNDDFINESLQHIMSLKMFDFIHEIVTLPSIFMKPHYCFRSNGMRYDYKDEHEVRIAFKMDKDRDQPVYLNGLGLIDLIEIVEQ